MRRRVRETSAVREKERRFSNRNGLFQLLFLLPVSILTKLLYRPLRWKVREKVSLRERSSDPNSLFDLEKKWRIGSE